MPCEEAAAYRRGTHEIRVHSMGFEMEVEGGVTLTSRSGGTAAARESSTRLSSAEIC